jgi:para-aminobenzoate synthetase/4-amino-4-deoxychorismate lyase
MLEWRECLHKATPLIGAARASLATGLSPAAKPTPLAASGVFETILGVDGLPVRLADHLARLDRSCRELYGSGVAPDLAGRVHEAAKTIPSGRAVLRVLVVPGHDAAVTAAPAPPLPAPLLACTRLRADGLWRHKWADRSWAVDAAEVLWLAADGAVLETDRGNIFLLGADGSLVTPPLRDDLLPGVTRRAVLDLARDEGRPTVLRTFDRAELLTRPAFWTSSLSGAVPIHRVDGLDLPRADEVVAHFAARLIGSGESFR